MSPVTEDGFMRLSITFLLTSSLGLLPSNAGLPKASLKSLDPSAVSHAADSAKMATETAAKQKAEALKMEAEAAQKKAEDSVKARAAALAQQIKDSIKAHMPETKPAPKTSEAVTPTATVVEAQPEAPKTSTKGCSLTKIVFSAKVENREPIDAALEFPAGNVSCWSRIACGAEPMTIQYLWAKDGKKVYDIPIKMKNSGRSWCNTNVTAGKWKVTLMKNGEEIGSGEMTVK